MPTRFAFLLAFGPLGSLSIMRHVSRPISPDLDADGLFAQIGPLGSLSIMRPISAPISPHLDADGVFAQQANLNSLDMHNLPCFACGVPPPERLDPNRTYVRRTDCGNHSGARDSLATVTPGIEFYRPGNATHNWTNGWCETNVEPTCADAIWNRDFLYFAKYWTADDIWNPSYCHKMGWTSPEIRALQNDFAGMDAKGRQECNSESLMQFNWSTTYSQSIDDVVEAKYSVNKPYTQEVAFEVGAFECSMTGGTAACAMAFCAYSYCNVTEHADGIIDYGFQEGCEGWDPVLGMPVGKDSGKWTYAPFPAA